MDAIGTYQAPAWTLSSRALKISAASWFAVAAVGQLFFVIYILGFYGRAAVLGNWENWNKVMPNGLIAGDSIGNLVLGIHLLFAAIITVSGVLQLLPQIRQYAPTFHRWNGRLYLLSAVLMSLGGLMMIWARGSVGGPVMAVTISINAVLILLFAALALRYALARNIAAHRRWALRLFLAVSGVWFFRVGLMFSLIVNQGPLGFDPETFRGPFLEFLGAAQYLLPLALLELYFFAQQSQNALVRVTTTLLLATATVATAVGVFAASMGMWLPRL